MSQQLHRLSRPASYSMLVRFAVRVLFWGREPRTVGVTARCYKCY